MVGICRGAQFLNVMCGGELFQHVNNHNKGQHEAVCTETGEIYNVTSAHHQMMIPSEEGEVLLVANETTERVFVERASVTAESLVGLPKDDIEAVFYEEEMCLCFQPHPEYVNKGDECYELFMTMMKENLGLEY